MEKIEQYLYRHNLTNWITSISLLVFLTGICLNYVSVAWLFALVVYEIVVQSGWSKEIVGHRYYTHRAFRVSSWVEPIMAYSTILTSIPVLFLAASHRAHHKYSDTEKDPHCPSGGLAFAFRYAIHSKKDQEWVREKFGNVMAIPRDLVKDSRLVSINKTHNTLFLLFAASCSIIDVWLTVFLLASYKYFHIKNTFIGLYLTHHKLWGSYVNWETGDNSTNTPWIGWFHPGEGYHNNHHHKQTAWDFALKDGERDCVASVIDFIRVKETV